ncbi:hypothetical protein CF15_06145 [Pyrodictium occultum]|uniref:Zinc finger ZPR1-type domain-containing protein n=2 Tax=Pyrodictium occultum TaxID=2309 RepID=A0A0V8RXH0_PYROC|nr:hypothetical protein CF15_06145 [Pyrodictium occultum]
MDSKPEKPESREPVKVNEAVIQCPVCGKHTLRVEDYLYEIPMIGKVILTTGKCSNCGYRFNDVRLAEAQEPRKILLNVEKAEDLNALVVRASSASILIPELGMSMTPGPASEGFITTVEGVLERFLEALTAACSSPDADKEACEKAKRLIEDAKEGKLKFTLVLVDPEGVSTIVSSKARVEPVSKKELEELGYIVTNAPGEESSESGKN